MACFLILSAGMASADGGVPCSNTFKYCSVEISDECSDINCSFSEKCYKIYQDVVVNGAKLDHFVLVPEMCQGDALKFLATDACR
jgi:hypothetical protein